LGEAGYKLWVDWSRNSEKFNEDDQLKTWQSFDREREAGAPRIGVGTLIKMAKDNKWRPNTTLEKKVVADEQIANTNKTFFVIRDEGGKCVVGHFAKNEFGGRNLKTQTSHEWKASRTNDLIVNPMTAKPVPYGKFWMDHPDRRTNERTDFCPGEPEILKGNVLNLYRGWGAEPRLGDWGLMREHIKNVLADGDEAAEKYILDFAAWCLQNPEKNAKAALVFRGKEGTGKGAFVRSLLDIFGSHSLHISDAERLTCKFNDHLETSPMKPSAATTGLLQVSSKP